MTGYCEKCGHLTPHDFTLDGGEIVCLLCQRAGEHLPLFRRAESEGRNEGDTDAA